MNRLLITIVILVVAFTISCKESSDTPAGESSGSNSGMTQSAPASIPSSAALPTPVYNPTVAAPNPAKDSGINPPHGQPNHRCDIPVGAPLNSPLAKPK